jgi:hypothetical protein
MLRREELNRLVITTLSISSSNLKASEIYGQILVEHPEILRDERVRGFRSFVKILNQFPEVKPNGCGILTYSLERGVRFK